MFGGVTKRKKTSISTHKKRRTNNNNVPKPPKPTQQHSKKQIKIEQPPTLTHKRSSSRAHKLQDSIVNDTSFKLTRTVLPPKEPDIKFLEVVNGKPKCMHITIESTDTITDKELRENTLQLFKKNNAPKVVIDLIKDNAVVQGKIDSFILKDSYFHGKAASFGKQILECSIKS